jgi:hypothetical protein
LKCVTIKRWKQKEKYRVNLTSVERKAKDTTDNIKTSHLAKKGSTKSEGDMAMPTMCLEKRRFPLSFHIKIFSFVQHYLNVINLQFTINP